MNTFFERTLSQRFREKKRLQSLCISENPETKTVNRLRQRVQGDVRCLNGGKSHMTLAALVAVPFLGTLGDEKVSELDMST